MPVQSAYTSGPEVALAGYPTGGTEPEIFAQVQGEASAEITFGNAVGMDTAANTCKLLTTLPAMGIVVRSLRYDQKNLSTDGNAVKPGQVLEVATRGTIWVTVVDGCARGDRPHIVKASGAFRATADAGSTRDFTSCGRYLTAAAAGGLAQLQFDFAQKEVA